MIKIAVCGYSSGVGRYFLERYGEAFEFVLLGRKDPDIYLDLRERKLSGDTAKLNCDYLALEEEIATDDTIAAVHAKGKKLIVWTVNDEDDIEEFLTSEADAIITDSVKLSAQTKERLMNRKPYEIILQKTLSLLK